MKLANMVEKISGSVTEGYQKIEDGVVGSLGAIVMGCGMSLLMTDIGAVLGMSETMMPGIVIGAVGMVMAIVNYPIYKRILAARRRKYADQIIALSDELMQD